jgi:integral membrane sensor domain MASE1
MQPRFTTASLRPVTGTALITLIYYATAELGFILALPPGNVTPVWPPSALALASALIIGYRAGAGVWLGSFLVNLTALSGDAALWAAAGIAAGSTLQMGAGAWLLRRFVPTLFALRNGAGPAEPVPITAREIAGFVALCALSSLVAASAGVTILCAAKFAPWSNFRPYGRRGGSAIMPGY